MNENKNLTIEETFNLAVQTHLGTICKIAQELLPDQVLELDPNHSQALNNLGVYLKN